MQRKPPQFTQQHKGLWRCGRQAGKGACIKVGAVEVAGGAARERGPGRAVARALSMVWECRRVARPLSSGVNVGRQSSQPLGSSLLMIDSYSPASCARQQRVTDVQCVSPGRKLPHHLPQLLIVAT